MIRVNLIEQLVLRQVQNTYEALSDEEKKVYDRKVQKEAKLRKEKYLYDMAQESKKVIRQRTRQGKRDKGMEIPPEVERSFSRPERLLPSSLLQNVVRTRSK